MNVIYIDVLFINNTVINIFLITATAVLFKEKIKPCRFIFGGATGALYSVCALFPDLGLVTFLPLRILIAILMTGISYGRWEWIRLIKYTLVFFVCSFALAGIMLGICLVCKVDGAIVNGVFYYEIPFFLPILAMITMLAAGALTIISTVKKYNMADLYRRVDIAMLGKKACITGFCDSGNSLTEPVTGLPVSVMSVRCAEKMFGRQRVKKMLTYTTDDVKLYPVFCKTACGSGFVSAFIPEEFLINGRAVSGMIAISDYFDGADCDVLINIKLTECVEEEFDDDRFAYCKDIQKSDK